MVEAFICDYIRTPIGRFGGSLSSVRADELGAVPLRALQMRNSRMDWSAIDEVIYGCANQAGEDNRNVARMSSYSWVCRPRFQAAPSIAFAVPEWMLLASPLALSKPVKPN